MEVHHHSHTPDPGLHRGRKWTHYFWEFLMLFLAVTLGFFVENQREHYIEHKREKIYVQSLFEDLKKDTALIELSAVSRKIVCNMIDTLILLLKSGYAEKFSQHIYYLARKIPYSEGRFSFNTKTFDQLKSSGNLRLIRNRKVMDMISDYYHDAANAAVRGPLDMNFENRRDLYLSFHKLFDAGIVHQMMDPVNPLIFHEPIANPYLITKDNVVINEICTRFHFVYGTHRVIMMDNERLKRKSLDLMQVLKKSYHLE